MKYIHIVMALALLATVMPSGADAHHSVFAEYDINGSVTIEGVVTEVWFKAPHIRIFVEVTDAAGNATVWNAHGHTPSALRRRGWLRDTLKVGEKITMRGDPTYDGSPKMFIRLVTREDGSVLENKVGN